MIYITVRQPPQYHQMTLEEFLFGSEPKSYVVNEKETNTRTYEVERVSDRFLRRYDVQNLIQKIVDFNTSTDDLRSRRRKDLYREFYIPKKKGGLRKIDAPQPELMEALRKLKTIFEEDFGALYHTSAFAYVKRRSTLDAIKRHQANESRWFGKYDLSNFFGSTTLNFVIKMFSMVFPFSEVIKDDTGRSELTKALELAFLDGGLPQGTPISPLITNIMMIPIDYKLANGLRDYKKQRYVYTRYADDFIVSSKYNFDFREIEGYIANAISSFEAPFTINNAKTRYGSSAGANWNLGLMLGAEGKITVGHRKKRQFQAMLHTFIMDTANGTRWSLEDLQVLEGYRNYYRMVERETIDGMIDHINKKHNVDVVAMVKEQIRMS